MINALSILAAEDGPHIAIAPEELFHLGPFTITNSHLYGWIAGLLITMGLILVARKMTLKPKGGFIQFIEMGADFVIGLLQSNLGNRQKAVKYAPYFGTIFFFVLMNNWLGLLPGVGPAIEYNHAPLLRPFTADWNGTLAIAITAITLVQYLAIKEQGGLNHLKHYFGGNFKNPINIFVGILEMFGELTRIFSLSLRLFFNILIGEILISIFTYIGRVGAPITTLPFLFMELFVGLVQAYIFTMLCITYLSIATAHGEHQEDHSPASEPTGSLNKRVEDTA